MNLWLPLWRDLRQAVADMWPEATKNFRAIQMQRINWANALEKLSPAPGQPKFTAPYVIVHIPPYRTDPSWGLVNVVYSPRITMHYLTNSGEGGGDAAKIEQQMSDMQDYLLTPGREYEAIQVLDDGFEINVGTEHPANYTYLRQVTPMSAGSISFSVLVGQSYE